MIERYIIYGLVVLAVLGAAWGKGYLMGSERLNDYIQKQAQEAVRIGKVRTQIVLQTQTKYRTKIDTIYKEGETVYVTTSDNSGCIVPVSFVRSFNTAYGQPAGPPADTDREPSGVPLSTVAETEKHNATSCRVYKEQRDGLIEFYKKQQAVK